MRVVSNPEFLREGSAVDDFLKPDRVVVGCDDRAAAIAVGALYDKVHAQVIVTDPASAETIKYAANAFLATKLSFINAIAAICEGVGADVNDVVVGMGYDKRIGTEFLRPGPGWGGSCFPKDSRALLKIANDAGYHFDLLAGVDRRQRRAVRPRRRQDPRSPPAARCAAARSPCGGSRSRPAPTTCATRRRCRSSTACSRPARTVQAFDPTVAGPEAGRARRRSRSAPTPYAAAAGADVLAVLTEWDDFRWLEPGKVAARDDGPRTSSTGATCSTAPTGSAPASRYQGIGR